MRLFRLNRPFLFQLQLVFLRVLLHLSNSSCHMFRVGSLPATLNSNDLTPPSFLSWGWDSCLLLAQGGPDSFFGRA